MLIKTSTTNGRKVGLFSAITNQEARQIAKRIRVPLFDKTKYDGNGKSYWNLNVHREHE